MRLKNSFPSFNLEFWLIDFFLPLTSFLKGWQNHVFNLVVRNGSLENHIKTNMVKRLLHGLSNDIASASNDQRLQVWIFWHRSIIRSRAFAPYFENLGIVVFLKDVPTGVKPIWDRHVQIQHNQIKKQTSICVIFVFLHGLKYHVIGLVAVLGHLRGKSMPLKHNVDYVQLHRVIIGYQASWLP